VNFASVDSQVESQSWLLGLGLPELSFGAGLGAYLSAKAAKPLQFLQLG
jgi:hypothetical protein